MIVDIAGVEGQKAKKVGIKRSNRSLLNPSLVRVTCSKREKENRKPAMV